MQHLDKTLATNIRLKEMKLFLKRLQHAIENTCKNMQQVQHPYITITTYL
jgi:hypothetical protein